MQPDVIARRLSDRLARGTGPSAVQLIVDDILLAIMDGTLEVGNRLPTARELAVALRVSPRTVEQAYEELERRGVLAARAGAGTVVSLAPEDEDFARKRRDLRALCEDVVARAAALGFDVDELIIALSEYGSEQAPTAERPS